jgi:hypothetical protein
MIFALQFVTSWAGVGTLIASGAAAVSAVVAVVMTKGNRKAVIEVHAIVNSTNKVLVERNEQLARMLQSAGVEIPASPEKPADSSN